MNKQATSHKVRITDGLAKTPKRQATVTPISNLEVQRALADPSQATPEVLQHLQQQVGNRGVQQLIQSKPAHTASSSFIQRETETLGLQLKPVATLSAQASTYVTPTRTIQLKDTPNAAGQINKEDFEYEIIAHKFAYDDIDDAGGDWLQQRGYQRTWACKPIIRSGLKACLLMPDATTPLGASRTPILVFKGTTPTKVGDLLADMDPVAVGFTAFKAGQEEIANMIKDCPKVDVTGHSLGGALAQHAASAFSDKIRRIVTFQSPGISSVQAAAFKGKKGVFEGASHHIAEGDLVDLAGGKHLAGDVFYHDLAKGQGHPGSHIKYLLNSDQFQDQRAQVGLDDAALGRLGVSGSSAKHSGNVTKSNGYPFRMRQMMTEGGRMIGSAITLPYHLIRGGYTAAKDVGGRAWNFGSNLGNKAWAGTRGWGRNADGSAKSGVGNWFKRAGGNVLGGLGWLGGKALGATGAVVGGALGATGATVRTLGSMAAHVAGAGVGAVGALGYGAYKGAKWLGGKAVDGAKATWQGAKWLGNKVVEGAQGVGNWFSRLWRSPQPQEENQ